ncbi:allergen Fus c 3 [Rhypophila decipiens]
MRMSWAQRRGMDPTKKNAAKPQAKMEQLVTGDPSPLSGFGGPGDLDGFGGPHHATYSNNQPTSIHVHERSTPAFSYSTAVSAARSGFAPVNAAPYDTSPIFTDPTPTTTYQARPTISPSPTYFQTGLEWQSSPASDLLYASEDSSGVSANSNVNAFGYVSKVSGQDPYMGDYASPGASQEGVMIDSSLYWTGDSPMGGGASYSNPGSNLASPILPGYGSLSRTPEGGYSDSDGDPAAVAAAAYGGNLGAAQDQITVDDARNAPPRKRAKNSPERNVPVSSPETLSGYRKPALVPLLASNSKAGGASDASGSGTAPATHKSKLRSASRTSKNILTRPSESLEERKTRNSHNLVEKQYRNRLNQHFENLLNALPDNVGTPGGSGGDSDGLGGGTGTSVDMGDRRLSKAEVLDMSRRYIQTLEKERDKLEREREELQGDISRMRSAYERGSPGGSGGSGGVGGSLSGS